MAPSSKTTIYLDGADYRRLNPGGANVRDLPAVTVTAPVPEPAVVPAPN